MVEQTSRFQVRGQAMHRPEKLLFSLKSVIAKYRAQGKVVKLCWLLAKMNNMVIQVQMDVGNTQKADIGAVIGQGTIGGGNCLPGQPG